jgi:hypothetical protein
MSWDTALRKFDRLSESYATPVLRSQIADAVARLDMIPVRDLLGLMAQARAQAAQPH